MLRRLPELVDFLQQAVRKTSLKGTWPVAGLERLREAVSGASGELVAELEFGRQSGFYTLQGTVEAELDLVCQRCLEPMKFPVSGSFRLGLVSSEEQMDALPAELEPCLVEGETQSIIELLEDELLLSLPIAPVHAEVCSEFLVEQKRQQQLDKENSSPFAVLRSLKTD